VSLGWQWDAVGPGTLALHAPIAKDHGKTITGLLRGDFMPSQKMDEIPLGHLMQGRIGGAEYPVVQPDDARNSLSVRDSREAKRTIIPRSEWQFATTVDGKITPSDRSIHLNGGFQPGRIYEYIYVVADPVISGLGLAAFRDFASYAKQQGPSGITPAVRVIAEGISQNGRFLRHLLYQGFNADEKGRIAIDGILSHVAGAGRGSFNHRFAQPSATPSPLPPSFSPPMSSRSPTNPKPILSPAKKAVSSIAPSPKKFSPRFSSRTLLTNTGAAPPRSFTQLPTQRKTLTSILASASTSSPACSTIPFHSRQSAAPAPARASIRKHRFRFAFSGAP